MCIAFPLKSPTQHTTYYIIQSVYSNCFFQLLFQLVEHELKDDGGEIQVTEENKMEYIELMLKWTLDRGVQEQTTAFVSGFREVRTYVHHSVPLH